MVGWRLGRVGEGEVERRGGSEGEKGKEGKEGEWRAEPGRNEEGGQRG